MTGQWRVTRVLWCGWVLWSGVAAVEKPTSNVGKPDWTIVTAFEDKKECDGRLRERIASLAERASKKMGYSTAMLADGVEIIEPDGSHGQRWTFICLPGGTDPRPGFREG